jgi:tetratricopeptide (TPR) repeat protein
MGNEREAFEAVSKAISLSPRELGHRLRRAGIATSLRIFDVAIRDYNEVLQSDPSHRGAELGLIQALADSGDRGTARTRVEKLLTQDPKDAAALYLKRKLSE